MRLEVHQLNSQERKTAIQPIPQARACGSWRTYPPALPTNSPARSVENDSTELERDQRRLHVTLEDLHSGQVSLGKERDQAP